MMERRLLRQLERVAARSRHRRLLCIWIFCWLAGAGAAALLVLINRHYGWLAPRAPLAISLSVAVMAVGGWWSARRSGRNLRRVARRIEAKYPELKSNLLAAIDQRAPAGEQRFGYLQTRVIEDALKHAYRNPWLAAIPPWHVVGGHALNLAAFLILLLSLGVLSRETRLEMRAEGEGEERLAATTDATFQVEVEPGDTEIERGTSLLVLARFAGRLPSDAALNVEHADGTTERFVMSQSLEDPLFGARIPQVDEPITYQIEFAEEHTGVYQVGVFELPRLVRADARLSYPSYTGLAEKVLEDVRTISAVQGTTVELLCRLNKEVASAEFVDEAGASTPLRRNVATEGGEWQYSGAFQLSKTKRLTLRLRDAEGRANKRPPEFVIRMLPNNPPDLKLVQPTQDLQVSPLEEVAMQANAWDDFGLARLGLSYTVNEREEEIVLAQAVRGKQRTTAEYLLALENLGAAPDELVSYYFWAEDQGPDGSVRRVASDMYFAEVRHFDEIFREGQQQPGGQQQRQGQQGGAAPDEELAELQKQIVNGTWKVIRREIAGTPTEAFDEDVSLLLESQTSALEQAEKLSEQVQQTEGKRLVLDVRRRMLDAVKQLSEARTNSQIESLQPALAAERAAYQALLRLRSVEHQVSQSRQQGGGGGGGGGNRAQRQLDQMQLRDNENRYETESAAQPEQEGQDAETRQVLNRLRELARRQGDLNERLKELQSALEEAESEDEEEELRRQLQRLREEQQRILRDIDEVQERMDRPGNQERMNEQQQQLSETRENVRRASDALEEGRIGSAVTAGTRAEREFEELRDEFRRRSSQRFQEEMRNLRQAAQDLEQQEAEIGEQLEAMSGGGETTPSLRDAGQQEATEEQLRQQREELQRVLDEMRELIQEAEPSEPLLADGLYDTARKTLQGNIPERLESAARSVRRGFLDDAKQEEQQAQAGIRELRQGIERAAEHVLGDETEALRRAQAELDRLREEVDSELARMSGQPAAGGDTSDEGREGAVGNESGAAPGERSEPGEASAAADAESPGQEQGDREGQDRSSAEGQRSSQGQRPSEGQPNGGQSGGQPSAAEGGQPAAGGGQAAQDQGTPASGSQTENAGQGQAGRGGGRPRQRRSLSGGGGGGGAEAIQVGEAGQRGASQREDVAPLTGDDFVDWSDRLRDVEEMVSDPELRAEAARIRDRARGIRREVKRHSQAPNWELVELEVVKPLAELQDRVSEEILRRSAPKSLVPIDRDPVPPKFQEQVRKYYERLGSSP